MTATAHEGDFETLSQVMTVSGTTDISDSDGNTGTLADVTVNLPRQRLSAAGRAAIKLAGGMTIDADGLDYDAKNSVWTFGRATVTLPQTPDAQDATDAPEEGAP
jgi:hypothetical protein